MKTAKSISVSEFKAKCLRLLEEVAAGDELVIRKRGKAIAKVTRIDDSPKSSSFGAWKGKMSTSGDLVHPGWDHVFDFE